MHHFLDAIKLEPIKPETKVIAARRRENDECAVWGWRPDIYVDGCPRPGVRDVAPDLGANPFGEYRRRQFLEDMQKNNPRFFLDAVCFSGLSEIGWYTTSPSMERKIDSYAPFPQLEEFVANHYVLKTQIPCNPGDWLKANMLGNRQGKVALEGVIKIYERHEDTNGHF